MPGPTQPGARTGGWKYQVGHVFGRGQPVYLQSQGVYALATTSTGFDGVVGGVAKDRFELVTAGELDGLSNLTPGQVQYLTSVAGVLGVTGTVPVLKALAPDTARVQTGDSTASSSIPYTFSVTALAGAVPLGSSDGALDPSWIPELPYVPVGEEMVNFWTADFRARQFLAAHELAGDPHRQYARLDYVVLVATSEARRHVDAHNRSLSAHPELLPQSGLQAEVTARRHVASHDRNPAAHPDFIPQAGLGAEEAARRHVDAHEREVDPHPGLVPADQAVLLAERAAKQAVAAHAHSLSDHPQYVPLDQMILFNRFFGA